MACGGGGLEGGDGDRVEGKGKGLLLVHEDKRAVRFNLKGGTLFACDISNGRCMRAAWA